MLSIDVGAEIFRNRALNCWPCVRSLTHSPDAVIHSPAAIVAAWPTVTKSRCLRAFARRTEKPFSALWKVTARQGQQALPESMILAAVSCKLGDHVIRCRARQSEPQ